MMMMTAKRCIHTPAGKQYIVPDDLKDLVLHMDDRKPIFTCLYFHAAWNPLCKKVDQDYENFTAKNGLTWTHIKVDCDKSPKIKFYFDARVEP